MMNPVEFVLLIDDDNATNFFNGMMLGKHDSFGRTLAVRSGSEALDFLQSIPNTDAQKPDLIFLDINMPGMNGWEFLDAFKELPVHITEGIKVILLSTSSNPEEVKKSMRKYSVDDYINKPLSMNILDSVYEVHFQKQYSSTS
ncbi:response regulator [Aureisphaera galaxeae]|uniref:response regulator n=1 Tax=Aureisphaera galaxeae TaxID=1538023 RepID=UPI0023506FD3|nr:response regulator [Aureisphaera galaxeae]MDC8004580.1 response regulator [Aureisphaera galaxeae]